MNKIPNFFRKRKTLTGEEVQSPTKDILTPAELDKLKNKIRQEIAAAELRIAYILNRQHRPKPETLTEAEPLIAAESLSTAEPLTAAEPLAREPIDQPPPIIPR